jgi:hypothetical protein
MLRGTQKLRIPNEHSEDVGVPLLKRLLKQWGISDDEWNNAGVRRDRDATRSK